MRDPQFGWIAAINVAGIGGWLVEQFMKSEMGLVMNIVLGIVGPAVMALQIAARIIGFVGQGKPTSHGTAQVAAMD